MTQAYNLSQLANNLNSSGQLDAADGLVNAVPIANGGTGANSQFVARGNLDVPSTSGGGATGTWPIGISGNAATATNATSATTASTCTGNSATATTDNQHIGISQTWQDMTASRTNGTTYTNSTTRPIQVLATFYRGDNTFGYVSVTTIVGGATIQVNRQFFDTTDNSISSPCFIVPVGATYSVTCDFSPLLNQRKWFELR